MQQYYFSCRLKWKLVKIDKIYERDTRARQNFKDYTFLKAKKQSVRVIYSLKFVPKGVGL